MENLNKVLEGFNRTGTTQTGIIILSYKDGALDEKDIGMKITNLINFENKFCEMFGLGRCGVTETYEYQNYYKEIRSQILRGYHVAYTEVEISDDNDIDKQLEKILDKGDKTVLLGIEY